MCFGSRGSITSGGAGEPFSPGTSSTPPPPPQMFIRVGGVWMGGLVLGGWVPQNPKTPQPLMNEAWIPPLDKGDLVDSGSGVLSQVW